MNNSSFPILLPLIDEVKKYISVDEDYATIIDPVFLIKRNRVNAEFCNTLLRMHDYPMVKSLINTLVKAQNKNGSWNEIHPNYNQQSSLITSIIGETLISSYHLFPHQESLELAKTYVLSQEKESGSFLKSISYTADHLNVDATCGAFLAQYGQTFSDQECLRAAERAARRICKFQIEGYYPYTTNKGNYVYNLNIPCIHYQGVTIYYLSKIQEILHQDWLKISILKGTEWLSNVQNPDGEFDWSKSGLLFAYHLSGAHAFAYASFSYVSQWDRKYKLNAYRSLSQIKNTIHGLVLRWEPDDRSFFLYSVPETYEVAKIGNFPFKERVFRFLYGLYRERARRHYSDELNDRSFKILKKLLRMRTSTIEPSNNYRDMFMTSEVLDCMSYAYTYLEIS